VPEKHTGRDKFDEASHPTVLREGEHGVSDENEADDEGDKPWHARVHGCLCPAVTR
jgi:hypothetical protein